MRVGSTQSSGGTGAVKGGGRGASGSGFSVAAPAQTAPASAAQAAGGVTGVGSLDALLALQAVGDPLERRRRAMGRAGRILDVLDEVKIALLDGALSPDALHRLTGAIRDQREATHDPKLEGLLDEIETRAAVELAKLDMMKRAA